MELTPVPQQVVELPPPVGPAPLSLDDCVRLALTNSPRLTQARAAIDQAYGAMVQAGLYPNPRIDNGNPQFILGGLNSVYNVGLTQPMVTAGKLRLSRRAEAEAMRQAELQYIRAQYDLLTDVRQQFFAILAAQDRIAILTQLVTILYQSEKTSADLLQAGRVSETDLLLTRVERQRSQANLLSNQQRIAGDRAQLAAAMGVPALPIDRVLGDLRLPIPALEQQHLGSVALAQNANVRSAEIDINRNRILLDRARAEPVPNIIWQGGYQRTLSPESPNQATIGIYADVPIWDRNQGRIRTAGANILGAQAELGNVRNEVLGAVADAQSRYRAAQQVVVNYEQGILPDARRGVELIQAGYERGLFDILRVLQAQRALVEANLDYISAQLDRLDAAAELAGLLQLETFP